MAEHLTGADIKYIRSKTGMNQKEFAEEVKVSYSFLTKLEVDDRTARPWFCELIKAKFSEQYKSLMDNKK